MSASNAQIQADYNTAKTALANLQTAFTSAAAAVLALEQACEQLEGDGAADVARVMRQQAATIGQGYVAQGNSPVIPLMAINPNATRNPVYPPRVQDTFTYQSFNGTFTP